MLGFLSDSLDNATFGSCTQILEKAALGMIKNRGGGDGSFTGSTGYTGHSVFGVGKAGMLMFIFSILC